jgi:mono/diheme cytochrome c family protein
MPVPSAFPEKPMLNRLALLVFATATALPVQAQDPAIQRVPPRYTSPASGPDMYKAYCASCHGTAGLGDGPVAMHLKAQVPDLTTLTRQNKGVFPRAQVLKVIQGEASHQTHGLKDMPVWGPVFLSLDQSQEPVLRIRVSNLANHIESLQAK